MHYKFSIAVLFALLGGKVHHCIAHRASPRWADGIVGKTDGSNRGGKTRKQNRFVQETTPGFSQPQHLRISSCSTVRRAFRYHWTLIYRALFQMVQVKLFYTQIFLKCQLLWIFPGVILVASMNKRFSKYLPSCSREFPSSGDRCV